MKIKVKIETEVDIDDEFDFDLFDRSCFICPEHRGTADEIKQCFLDELINILGYGIANDDEIVGEAVRLKKAVLESIIIEIDPSEIEKLEKLIEEGKFRWPDKEE